VEEEEEEVSSRCAAAADDDDDEGVAIAIVAVRPGYTPCFASLLLSRGAASV